MIGKKVKLNNFVFLGNELNNFLASYTDDLAFPVSGAPDNMHLFIEVKALAKFPGNFQAMYFIRSVKLVINFRWIIQMSLYLFLKKIN